MDPIQEFITMVARSPELSALQASIITQAFRIPKEKQEKTILRCLNYFKHIYPIAITEGVKAGATNLNASGSPVVPKKASFEVFTILSHKNWHGLCAYIVLYILENPDYEGIWYTPNLCFYFAKDGATDSAVVDRARMAFRNWVDEKQQEKAKRKASVEKQKLADAAYSLKKLEALKLGEPQQKPSATTKQGGSSKPEVPVVVAQEQPELENVLCCSICREPYDDDLRRPLILTPCGHTYCATCLTEHNAGAVCWECSRKFEDMKPNYEVQRAVYALRELQTANRPNPTEKDAPRPPTPTSPKQAAVPPKSAEKPKPPSPPPAPIAPSAEPKKKQPVDEQPDVAANPEFGNIGYKTVLISGIERIGEQEKLEKCREMFEEATGLPEDQLRIKCYGGNRFGKVFMSMPTREAAKQFIDKYDGECFPGHKNIMSAKHETFDSKPKADVNENNDLEQKRTLYIQNLPNRVTSEDVLKELLNGGADLNQRFVTLQPARAGQLCIVSFKTEEAAKKVMDAFHDRPYPNTKMVLNITYFRKKKIERTQSTERPTGNQNRRPPSPARSQQYGYGGPRGRPGYDMPVPPRMPFNPQHGQFMPPPGPYGMPYHPVAYPFMGPPPNFPTYGPPPNYAPNSAVPPTPPTPPAPLTPPPATPPPNKPAVKKSDPKKAATDKSVVCVRGLPATVTIDELITTFFSQELNLKQENGRPKIYLVNDDFDPEIKTMVVYLVNEELGIRTLVSWNAKMYPDTKNKLVIEYYGANNNPRHPSLAVLKASMKARETDRVLFKNLPPSADMFSLISIFHNLPVGGTKIQFANPPGFEFTVQPDGLKSCNVKFATKNMARLIATYYRTAKFPGTEQTYATELC